MIGMLLHASVAAPAPLVFRPSGPLHDALDEDATSFAMSAESPWRVTGRWAVVDGVLVRTRPSTRSFDTATIDGGRSQLRVSAVLRSSAPGVSLAVRYRSARDHWRISRIEGEGSNRWTLEHLDDGSPARIEEATVTGGGPGADSTVLVELRGEQITVIIDGTTAFDIGDPALSDATGVGAVATQAAGAAPTLVDLEVEHLAEEEETS